MASTDAHPWAIKGAAYRTTFPIFKNDGTVITGATSISSTVSKDGGAFAATTNTVSEITGSGVYLLDLTATEMTADTVVLKVTSTSTGAVVVILVWQPVSITEPTTVPAWPMSVEAALGWLAALARNKTTQTATTTTLRNDTDSANISTSTITDDGTTYTRGEWA